MIIYIVAILTFLGIYIYQKVCKTKEATTAGWKEIPFEKGLPIIGVLNKIKEPFCYYLMKLSQKHGPIFRIRFGMREIVVLNTFEYIKAALVDNAEAFTGRWKSEKFVFVTDNAGLVFIDGDVFAKQRAFTMKTLKDFGVGRSRSVEIIHDECAYLMEDLDRKEGQKINIIDILSFFSLNIISKFVMNKRLSHEDPEFDVLQKFMSVVVVKGDPIAHFSLMFPFLENHEWLIKFVMWVTQRKKLADDFYQLIRKEIDEHRNKLDFESEGDDLIDRFLIRQSLNKENTGSLETFTDWQLMRNVFDLLMTGIDTVTITLSWSFFFMGMYPDIQDKVHQEIIDQLGNQKFPIMGDKAALTYTQAVMDESFRLASTVPLALMHRALTPVNVKGHVFPTDTIIIPNLIASFHDPNVWEKPFEFYPEHFLSTDANGELKYNPREELVIYSMGKRQCLGEPLARMELFMFFVSILQRFQISLVKKVPHFDVFTGNPGILRKPSTEEFILKKR